jgi:HEAT repeat protein
MRTLRSLFACPLVAALALAGCQESDPAKPATWLAKLSDKDSKVVIDALEHLKKLKSKEGVPQIVAELKVDDGKVRETAAAALEEIGDPQAVQPLSEAVDLGTSEKAIALANMKIADALGAIGDKSATPTLIKMLHSRDDNLRLQATKALDKLKDPKSAGELMQLVTSDTAPNPIVKYSIIALGDMQSVEAIPVLAKGMVIEKNGASFFPDASYALFQIGSPAVPVLDSIVDGSGKEYLDWADKNSRSLAGWVSKCAIVLADIGDPSSIPVLVKALSWKDPNDNSVYTNLVRGKIAEALGRLRAKDGAIPLANSLAGMDDANMRALFATAIAHIDDPVALPKMEAAIKNVKDTWSDRQETISGLTLFADGKEKPLLESVQKVETADKALKECLAIESQETPEAKQARCKKGADERVQFLVEEIARLGTGEECKQDLACWTGKLKDPSLKIRERAAYEIGKIGGPASVDALLVAAKDEKTYVRRAAYVGLDWLTRVDSAKPALKAKADVITAQYENDKSVQMMQIVNEDLKRVVWKVQHL